MPGRSAASSGSSPLVQWPKRHRHPGRRRSTAFTLTRQLVLRAPLQCKLCPEAVRLVRQLSCQGGSLQKSMGPPGAFGFLFIHESVEAIITFLPLLLTLPFRLFSFSSSPSLSLPRAPAPTRPFLFSLRSLLSPLRLVHFSLRSPWRTMRPRRSKPP